MDGSIAVIPLTSRIAFHRTGLEYWKNQSTFLRSPVMGEIFNTAILAFTLIPLGLVLGFALLKLQGGTAE